MNVKVKVHPLGEILSKKLFGISSVPPNVQNKMVNTAIKAAMKYHDEEIKKIRNKV